MEDAIDAAEAIQLICPTCGARYTLPKYVQGQRYGCKRCSASLLFAKFALLKELGRGGFGVVYKAYQVDLQRTVALKFLHSDSEESTERFIREARIAAQLNHPNIAAIYDVGQHDGKLYISMQFIDGKTVNKLDFSPREAVQVIREAALAVDYAHARQIVHRDLKPHNIMLSQERSGTASAEMSQRAYVMDFGLARSVVKDSSLTVEGQVIGTPAFMSPEQAEGKPVDLRSDVYSLGATLYSLVTKRAPFEGSTPVEILMRVATGSPTPPSKHNPEVDPDLEAIILKAMHVYPDNRYPTAGRLAADLGLWIQGKTPDAGPTIHLSSTPVPATRRAPISPSGGRKKALVAAAFVAFLVAAAGGAAVKFLKTPEPKDLSSKNGKSTDPVRPTSPDRPSDPVKPPPPLPVAPARVVLEVKPEPKDATVRVVELNRDWSAPAKLNDRELPPGHYTLEISKAGYDTAHEKVSIVEGNPILFLTPKLNKTPRAVAFTVDSNPRGAEVLLNREVSGETPLTVFKEDLKTDRVEVVAKLKGFEPERKMVEIQETPQEVKFALKPQTGTFLVRGAAPKAQLHLFSIPRGVQDPRALLSLWSENPDAVERAIEGLDRQDAAFVTERLRDLATRVDPKLRNRVAELAAVPPAPGALKPEQSLPADAAGKGRFENAWVTRRYRFLATAPMRRDFISDDYEPELGRETELPPADMLALALLSVRTRPAVGQFRVELGDGSVAGQIAPDGRPLRVPAGKVTLLFLPPANDPLLRDFTREAQVVDKLELTGNVYFFSALAAQREGNPELAVRGFMKYLEETGVPPAEEKDRRELPGKIAALYRSWVEALPAKPAGAEAGKKVEEARKKPPAEALAPLLEFYAAPDAAREVKGAAAGSLALAHARLGRPYEAMEWLERAVLGGGIDPGPETEAAFDPAVRKFPGLAERWGAVSQLLADLRRAANRRPGFIGIRVSEVAGRGLRIDAIVKGGPEETAGLRLGDILTALGNDALRARADLEAALKRFAEGERVELRYDRGGERGKTVLLRLAPVPEKEPVYAEAPPRLGVVQLVHKDYGIFINLDPDVQVREGEVIEFVRNGEIVEEIAVQSVRKPDPNYLNGSAVCRKGKGLVQKGDEARKGKK